MHLHLKPALLMTRTDRESKLNRPKFYLAVQPGLGEAVGASAPGVLLGGSGGAGGGPRMPVLGGRNVVRGPVEAKTERLW